MIKRKTNAAVAEDSMPKEYREWILSLKNRYRSAQVKAAVSVNSALLEFYWGLGRDISERYPGKKRWVGFFEKLSEDLRMSLGNAKGLSVNNLRYCQHFYELYSYLQQPVGDNDECRCSLVKIPWGHHVKIIDKSAGDREKALFYVRKTIEFGWSRSELMLQLEGGLYEKSGKTTTNFSATLLPEESRLANELVKSEYSFALTEQVDENNEREVEKALVRNITRTLTELGGGFAYVGHQVRIQVGEREFWPDLIFYHLKARRYLVIELKTGEFEPEHIGQLGFYMTAVDRQIKNEWDGKTVGLVLCRSKDRVVVEYALADSGRPMGVAKYQLTQLPPEERELMGPAVARVEAAIAATNIILEKG